MAQLPADQVLRILKEASHELRGGMNGKKGAPLFGPRVDRYSMGVTVVNTTRHSSGGALDIWLAQRYATLSLLSRVGAGPSAHHRLDDARHVALPRMQMWMWATAWSAWPCAT